MNIPEYPKSAPINIEMRPGLHNFFYNLENGISEFTFAGLYLFRDKYNYRISRIRNGDLIILGQEEGSEFCMVPSGFRDTGMMKELIKNHHYFKALSERDIINYRIAIEREGYCILEDRDNFDYLYLRSNLVHLTGRKFHKKRNMVNAFISNYSYEEKFITPDNLEDALFVLMKWKENRIANGLDTVDCNSAEEGLRRMGDLELTGCITYVDKIPAAYSLGESVSRGRSFIVQFEKAIGDYKGIYQFINRSFASMIDKEHIYINREQDLGDPGLRQAKMSYRPDDFIKKYKVFSDPEYCRCRKCSES